MKLYPEIEILNIKVAPFALSDAAIVEIVRNNEVEVEFEFRAVNESGEVMNQKKYTAMVGDIVSWKKFVVEAFDF